MFTNANTKWMIYKELELIPDSVPEPIRIYPPSTPSWFTKIWQKLVDALNANNEPKIWRTIEADGKAWWNVYDSNTGHTFYMASEEEVLIWLDQHYGIG
ncbi:MAG: hypothetical protein K6T90_17965 [Leptolyngbyaceae cyanobacterium HOT.MB2.61]|nr:hypothetical protein [Leptolyngbyaceae cyanobacterium HOT.MB2.61]